MKDFLNSQENAALRQGWAFDDRWSRIGSPYIWVDGDRMDSMLTDQYAMLQFLSMYYEKYETLAALKTSDHDAVYKKGEETLRGMLDFYFPFLPQDKRVKNNIECTALTRTQDYCFIRQFCKDLAANPTHLDIGPGLGSHAMYSTFFLKGRYLGLEASKYSYEAQRYFFRHLAALSGNTYCDPISAEKINGYNREVGALVNDSRFKITHVPSWYAEDIKSQTVDLVTATWVLNEVSPAGITWLLSHSLRSLKMGGYFYIRDSHKLKPNRHAVNYDELLQKYGCERVKELEVTNRVDMFGIPRAYQKKKEFNLGFEEFFDQLYGRFAITVHQGEYMQNLSTAPIAKK